MRVGKFGINVLLLLFVILVLDMLVVFFVLWFFESFGDCKVVNELGVNVYGFMNGCICFWLDDIEWDLGFFFCGEFDIEYCGWCLVDFV